MKFVKFSQLPEALQAFARIILAAKSLEAGKEAGKEEALAALKEVLAGEKALIALSSNHFIQFDVNPQQHLEFDPLDSAPEIKALLAAQAKVKEAASAVAAATKTALAAGRATTRHTDSIRGEVLSEAKLQPIKNRHALAIQFARREVHPI